MKIIKPSVELLWITPNAEKMIERAGRVCYKSENIITSDSHIKFIENIIKKGHEAVLEHASASLLFICDRGVSHELVRHRIASYCQESTRYCDYTKEKFGYELTFIEPCFKEENSGRDITKRNLWEESIKRSEEDYKFLRGIGVTPEEARSILPNSLKTEIVVTANMREFRHIIKIRTSNKAHPQIREVILIAKDILKKECPNIFGDL